MIVSLLILGLASQGKAEFFVLRAIGTANNRMQEPVSQISVAQMTDDGRTVVGTSTNEGMHRALVWRVGKQAYSLDLPSEFPYHYYGTAASADGRTFGGAAIWTEPGTPLHKQYGKTTISMREMGLGQWGVVPHWINRDGTMMSFEVDKPGDAKRGFIVFPKRRKIAVAFGRGEPVNGAILDVTPDGQMGVGVHDRFRETSRAFVWSLRSQRARLLPIPDAYSASSVTSVSDDGRTILGWVEGPKGKYAHGTWDSRGRFTVLPALGSSQRAYMSQGGEVFAFSSGSECFIWTKRRGLQNLRDLLTKSYGLHVSATQLLVYGVTTQATTVTILGGDEYHLPVWVARIPREAVL